jgi:uncharacterized protein YbjQ (UPF0145 family)
LGVNVISDSIASFSDFFGGSSGTYRSKLEDLKKTVLNDLKNQALNQGADAIVGFGIAFNEISGKGKQMFMATATGTAVKLGHNRFEYARKMHELTMFHNECIFTDSEYENEVEILKASVDNVVAIESEKIEEQKRIKELEKKRYEEEHAEELKRKEEAEARRKEERREYQNKHAEILQVIEKEFANHKEDIKNMKIEQIDAATYNDIMPKGEISHYDIMRYFVAIGRADAAAKFYVDKFNLSAQDAIQYLSAI